MNMLVERLLAGVTISLTYFLCAMAGLSLCLLLLDLLAVTTGFDLFFEIWKCWWRLRKSKINYKVIASQRRPLMAAYLFELLGVENYLMDSPAHRIRAEIEDNCGTLYTISYNHRIDVAVFVKVKNSTAEPDGSFRFYYIRVHPFCSTPRQAVAWTFGLSSSEYCPATET
jgi:hypothetical protein